MNNHNKKQHGYLEWMKNREQENWNLKEIKKKENYSQMLRNIDEELRQNTKIKASLFTKC